MHDGEAIKIKLSSLMCKKGQDGAKLFNLAAKEKALKIQWISTYFKNVEIRT